MLKTYTRDEILSKVVINLDKYPLIKEYYLDIITNLISTPKKSMIDILEIQLIRYLFVNDSVLKNLEIYLENKQFTNIVIPFNRLKTNFFSEYSAVLSELDVASILKEEGMKNVTFIDEEDNPDIQYTDNTIIRYAEVKNLDESDPEYPILYNKLEAHSMVDTRYNCFFYIRLNNEISSIFKGINHYKESLVKAVNRLIVEIDKYIDEKKLEDKVFQIDKFNFIVSFDKKEPNFNLMYSGDVMKYGSNKDIFLKMSSVYSRFINKSAEGIRQLAKKRNDNIAAIIDDRLYIYLNTGRHADFIPDKLELIINKLAEELGINDIINLKIKL